MVKKCCRIAVCSLLIVILLLSAALADVLSEEDRYQNALAMLNAYLSQSSGIDLSAVINEFTSLSGFRQAGGFMSYAKVMQQLESPEPQEGLLQGLITVLNSDESLKQLLADESFRANYSRIHSVDEVSDYVTARLAERRWENGKRSNDLAEAVMAYQKCFNFSDAGSRYLKLQPIYYEEMRASSHVQVTVTSWKDLQQRIYDAGQTATTALLASDLSADFSDTAIVIPAGARITVNLQGHTLNRASYNPSDTGSVFIVQKDASLTVMSQPEAGRITGGYTSGVGGGIFNEGTLTLDKVEVSGNQAYDGGALFNSGILILHEAVICDNSARNGSGSGAGIFNTGEAYVNTSSIRENSGARYGGAIFNRGQITVIDSQIEDNFALELGGGIYNENNPNEAADATVTLIGVDLTKNTAHGTGGGMHLQSGIANFRDRVSLTENHSFQGAGLALVSGTLNVQDSVIITGNHNDGNLESNLVIIEEGNRIVISDRLNEDARIGITLLNGGGQFTRGFGVYNSVDPAAVFVHDGGETILQDNREAALKIAPVYTGWQLLNGKWYYYTAAGELTTGWQLIDNVWYYLKEDGAMATGWQYLNNSWFYFPENGKMVTGLQQIGDFWFYFNEDGKMQTGWQVVNDCWYYFDEDTGDDQKGRLLTGWQFLNDSWYYLGDNGVMVTGWQVIGDSWYCFTSDGRLLTGWQQLGDDWYYFAEDGKMAIGWTTLGDHWYYFDPDGKMAANWEKINDFWYHFTEKGELHTGWQQLNNHWYYFGDDGKMAEDWLNIDNHWYYFGLGDHGKADENGVMAVGWKSIEGKWYYFNQSGWMLTGWQTIDGKMYYFTSAGVMR